MAQNPTRVDSPFSRRGFLGLAVGGLGGMLLPVAGSALAASAATSSPTPKLPGEYYRLGTRQTPSGVLYDDICVRIQGDEARMWVPQTVKPGVTRNVAVAWFYHGSGSDHNALGGGFKTHAELVIDSGAIAICQKAGGTLYSHPRAVDIQVAGGEYMASVFNPAFNVLRSTSGGGALASETYARKLIPNITGMYSINSVYDIEAMYRAGGASTATIVSAFGNDPAAIAAANPARHGAAAWAGTRTRVVVSQPNSSDVNVPPSEHGLALLSLAAPVAAEASLKWHTSGHNTPGFAKTDFVQCSRRWIRPAADLNAPAARVTFPAAGASITETVTLSAAAADDISIASVVFTAGSVTVPARLNLENATISSQPTATVWVATLDTTALPNGPISITATAKDPSGNTTVSAPVSVTVSNAVAADTTAPSVAITSPADRATVRGTTTIVVAATDDVAVTKVELYVGTRLLGRPADQGNGLWALSFNTKSPMSPNGTYPVTAKATDAAGNTTTSAPVRITVAN